jgi:PST family polysaccharide transporter
MALSQPHPETLNVIRAMSLFLFFEGLAIVPKTFFDAELRVGRTVLPEIIRNLIFAALSLTLALTGFGVWSLVIAQIACTIYYALHLWIRAWGEIPWNWERGQTAALVLRSLPLATIWFLAVFVQYVDPIILGLRFSQEVIGEYTFAYKLAFLVPLVVVPAMTRTLYPALVAFKEEPEKLMEAYRLGTLFVIGLMTPAAGFLFTNPEVPQIISSEYVIADSLLVLLCLTPLIDPFSRLGGEVLKTFHHDGLWIFSVALTLASFIGFGLLFTSRYGPIGMAWANFLQIGMLPMAWGIYRLAPGPFKRLVRDLAILYAVPVIPFVALKLALPDALWLRIGLSIVASLAVVAVYYRLFGRSFLEFFRAGTTPQTTDPS